MKYSTTNPCTRLQKIALKRCNCNKLLTISDTEKFVQSYNREEYTRRLMANVRSNTFVRAQSDLYRKLHPAVVRLYCILNQVKPGNRVLFCFHCDGPST